MASNNEDQANLREMISSFLVENPMSWYRFSKGCGISHTTLRKFAGGIDLKRVEPLFKMMKFMKGYKNE